MYRYAGLSSINFAANRGERLLLLTTGTVLMGPRSSGYFVKSRLEEGQIAPFVSSAPFTALLRGGGVPAFNSSPPSSRVERNV